MENKVRHLSKMGADANGKFTTWCGKAITPSPPAFERVAASAWIETSNCADCLKAATDGLRAMLRELRGVREELQEEDVNAFRDGIKNHVHVGGSLAVFASGTQERIGVARRTEGGVEFVAAWVEN